MDFSQEIYLHAYFPLLDSSMICLSFCCSFTTIFTDIDILTFSKKISDFPNFKVVLGTPQNPKLVNDFQYNTDNKNSGNLLGMLEAS